MKKSSLILLGTIAFIAGTVVMPLALQAGPTITAKLTASPSSLTAYCPATIKFTGAIKVDNVIKAPVTVQYKFVRSDGGSTAPITLNCPSAGVYPVNTTWTIGATYSGWEAIEVISPVAVKSEKAPFTLTCLSKPQIDELYPENTNLQDTNFTVFGNNFGATQGNKNVTLDGQPALPKPGWSVELWSDKQIFITIKTCDIIIWDHPYQIAITDGGQVVSNVVSRRFLYMVRIHSGQENYFPGQAITVDVRNLPSSSSGYSLKLYSAFIPLPITKWTGAVGCIPGTITATIPQNTPAGSYQVELFKGGTRVSWDYTDINVVKFQPVIKK
jgi:hypothetical protein